MNKEVNKLIKEEIALLSKDLELVEAEDEKRAEAQSALTKCHQSLKEAQRGYDEKLKVSEETIQEKASEFYPWRKGMWFTVRNLDQMWAIDEVRVKVKIGKPFNRFSKNEHRLYDPDQAGVEFLVLARKVSKAGNVDYRYSARRFTEDDMQHAKKV